MTDIENEVQGNKRFYGKLGIIGWPKSLQYALLGTLAAGGPVLLVGEPGSMKTTFIRRIGELLGLKTRIYDVDKLSAEVLMGELNPAYVDYTGKSIDRLTEAVVRAASKKGVDYDGNMEELSKLRDLVGEQFINSVTEYELIGWDEILRGEPASQQSLLLNILQDRSFQGRYVSALQVCCTNTGFDELFEFNEALLNRFWMIFQCPSFKEMSDSHQNQYITSCGHNKASEKIGMDLKFASMDVPVLVGPKKEDILAKPLLNEDGSVKQGFDGKPLFDMLGLKQKLDEKNRPVCTHVPGFFEQLGDMLNGPTQQDLDGTVKLFLRHLKHPLSVALGSRLSARKLDHMAKVLYTTLFTYMVIEEVMYKDIKMEDLQQVIRDTFLSTIYLNDLSENEVNQVNNSFHLAFNNTFNIEELSLRDRLLSVPHFLVNAEDFSKHIDLPTGQHDLAGVHVFAQRLKNECRNNKPLRYILYKWFVGRVDSREVVLESDVISPIRNKLQQMQSKMDSFTATTAEIRLSSKTLDPSFLAKVQQAATDRMFSGMKVNTNIYAELVTTINCFDPDKVQSGEDYISDMYTTLAELKRI